MRPKFSENLQVNQGSLIDVLFEEKIQFIGDFDENRYIPQLVLLTPDDRQMNFFISFSILLVSYLEFAEFSLVSLEVLIKNYNHYFVYFSFFFYSYLLFSVAIFGNYYTKFF